jgi:hypothetical protein
LLSFPVAAVAEGQAALRGMAPAGARRGTTVTFTLTGLNLSEATAAIFDDPAIASQVKRAADPANERNRVQVEAVIGPAARVGIHRLYLATPHGATTALTFAVGAWPEVVEKEPNDDPQQAARIALPATVTGVLDHAGDVDCFRFEARAGQELLFEAITGAIRSRLTPVLSLLDAEGRVLVDGREASDRPENLLGYRFPADGTYTIRIADAENASGGDVTYRLNVGEFAYVTGVYPLGVPAGATTEVAVQGYGLGGLQRVKVTAPPTAGRGQTIPLPLPGLQERLLNAPRIAVGADPEISEGENDASDTPAGAMSVSVPVTINGRIYHPNAPAGAAPDADCYRFHARKGEALVLEVAARRLGSPLDSFVEVLDEAGRPVERATLRCVAQTVITLSDRDSASRGLRLLAWADLRVNDLVYINGEVLRISALPRGPDDDCVFDGFRGQRIGLLDTTPHGLSVETPVYKVRVYPPGRTFPLNGMPVFHLKTQNDDGGPLYGKDSRMTFVPPADGEYVARIRDVREQEGERYAYRLAIHPPRPDYRLTLSPEHPNVPRGAAVPVEVTAERYDGFDGEIEVHMEGLPAGLTASPARINAGETSATLAVTAAPDAPPLDLAAAKARLVGRAVIGGQEVVRTVEPDNGYRLVTPLSPADLSVAVEPGELMLPPGGQVVARVRIERRHGFGGRVPIEVRNLPDGVRVLDVGLNGVLVTESETTRQFTLYAEPWTRPQTRPLYAVGTIESDPPTQVAAPPLVLHIGRR